jgi:hypothetical protein
MDAQTFDRFVVTVTHRPTRRAALRLLAGGVLGALLTRTGAASVLAQRSDRDGDGLFDDDETDVYGTNPDNPDSDGDGTDDGQEVFDGTDPLTPNGGGGAAPAGCPAGQTDCGGVCVSLDSDRNHCGACSNACPPGDANECSSGVCVAGCFPGQTNCGGFCVNHETDSSNCGGCGSVCPSGTSCVNSACTAGCAPADTFCSGVCVNLQYEQNNCGACGHVCEHPAVCVDGECAIYFEGCGATYNEPCTTNNDCCPGLVCLQVQGGGICRPNP